MGVIQVLCLVFHYSLARTESSAGIIMPMDVRIRIMRGMDVVTVFIIVLRFFRQQNKPCAASTCFLL